jgi:hypothetical protein
MTAKMVKVLLVNSFLDHRRGNLIGSSLLYNVIVHSCISPRFHFNKRNQRSSFLLICFFGPLLGTQEEQPKEGPRDRRSY